jgi:hypothetical protein
LSTKLSALSQSQTNTSICPIAWEHFSLSPLGSLRLCHRVNANTGFSTDGEKIYRMPFNIEEARNSQDFQIVRQKMLDGLPVEACSNCNQEEANTGYSNRLKWLEEKPDFLTQDLSKISANSAIQYLDLRLGNTCNLKCRMCNPYSSSLWEKDWEQMGELVSPMSALDKQRVSNEWWNDEQTWSQLKLVLPTAREIYMTGGEPLLQKVNKNIIKYSI